MKKLKIEVTAVDIKKGLRLDPNYCPIAQAIRREFPNSRPSVGLSSCKLDKHDNAIFELPAKAKKFVQRFDSMLEVKPISFTAKRI